MFVIKDDKSCFPFKTLQDSFQKVDLHAVVGQGHHAEDGLLAEVAMAAKSATPFHVACRQGGADDEGGVVGRRLQGHQLSDERFLAGACVHQQEVQGQH